MQRGSHRLQCMQSRRCPTRPPWLTRESVKRRVLPKTRARGGYLQSCRRISDAELEVTDCSACRTGAAPHDLLDWHAHQQKAMGQWNGTAVRSDSAIVVEVGVEVCFAFPAGGCISRHAGSVVAAGADKLNWGIEEACRSSSLMDVHLTNLSSLRFALMHFLR